MNDYNNNLGYVSVIMPAFNSERFIKSSIDSVINQKYQFWNLLVINDGSTDNTASIVNAISGFDDRVQLVNNQGVKGAAGARNYGLECATGDYVAFIDSDDIWHPEKLLKQLSIMRDKGADFSYTSYEIIDEYDDKKNSYIVPETIDYEKLLKQNVVGCSTVIISRKLVERHRFTTEFYHEDYCMWLDFLKNQYNTVGIKEPLVKWRSISGSRSHDKRNSAKRRWQIYRVYLKLPFLKSLKFFLHYMFNGVKKHFM